jgi:Protein of unknown function (DUF2510)
VAGSPKGWYEDPYGRMPFRWWDGTEWSPYARGDEVEWDPVDEQPVAVRRAGFPMMGFALLGFAVAVGLSYTVLTVLRSNGKPGGPSVELVLTEIALWLPMLVLVTETW